MTPTERSAKFCKVYLGHRNTMVLSNWSIAQDRKGREMVSGISADGQKQFFRVSGMRVVPMAASCDGELVPLRDACHCNVGMAKAVEAGYAWAGKPQVVTFKASPAVKSFRELGIAMKAVQRG